MKPLAGRTVLVTRPADQSVELVRRLRRLGATAIVAPDDRDRAGAIRPADRGAARPVGGPVRLDHAHQPSDRRDAGVATGLPVGRPREGGGDRRGHGHGVPRLGATESRPHAHDVHHGRVGTRLPARHRAGPLRAGRHRPCRPRRCAGGEGLVCTSASTRTGPVWHGRSPPTRGRRSETEASTPSRSPAPRRCAGSSERWAWSAGTRRS